MNKLIQHAQTLRLKVTFDEFDSATIGSVILGVGDIVWLTKDILHNGFGSTYMIIALLFLVGNILLVIGLHQHNVKTKTIKVNKAKRLRRTKAQMRADVERELSGLN